MMWFKLEWHVSGSGESLSAQTGPRRCTSPVAQRWHISVPAADRGNRTDCTLLPLSGSDSKARALHDHGDAGLHGTVTNISQLHGATGEKSCKMGLHIGVFHVAVKHNTIHHRSASD